MYAEAQLARYKKKMKEFFDKHKAMDRQFSVSDTVFVFQLILKHQKQINYKQNTMAPSLLSGSQTWQQ